MSVEPENPRELTEGEARMLKELAETLLSIKALEEFAAKLKSSIATSMDTYTHGTWRGVHVVTVSRYRPERFDVVRFRQDHPHVARAYTLPAENETVKVLPRPAARDIEGLTLLEL